MLVNVKGELVAGEKRFHASFNQTRNTLFFVKFIGVMRFVLVRYKFGIRNVNAPAGEKYTE